MHRFTVMDEKDFKKHLQDLVHGHHHPEEHDWSPDSKVRMAGESPATAPKPKRPARKRKR